MFVLCSVGLPTITFHTIENTLLSVQCCITLGIRTILSPTVRSPEQERANFRFGFISTASEPMFTLSISLMKNRVQRPVEGVVI